MSTGANLYHDLHETRGRHHYLGSAQANDAALAFYRIDCVVDETYASEECSFAVTHVLDWPLNFVTLEQSVCTPLREFLNLLGAYLWYKTKQNPRTHAAYRVLFHILLGASRIRQSAWIILGPTISGAGTGEI